ncbi:MAG: insulinase family protein [Deltaproteobacteria bacterium]|nr:insulinase family protein [Deltaproteobacteria bacterium]
MAIIKGFLIKKEQEIRELKTFASLYVHEKTGAEILSLVNDDENKVFGITFRTPPSDSTGIPHILEHSVLCGSRRYPVKEPFVELLKGSLQTFLNAMTYPDKTCYPVASQNLQDFYNLIDVYLDAVFYPRLTPFIFQQEGWHYEMEQPEDDLRYKGVVFNEMKGAYSSPDNLIADYSLRYLFPDNAYGFDSGGDPKKIPGLKFEKFRDFHRKYYHPSNSRIYFYGNDEPQRRLHIIKEYLDDFDRMEIDSSIILQKSFDKPQRVIRSFAAGEGEDDNRSKGMITINWMLSEASDSRRNLAMHILEYILLGMPGSPLRKALIESNLGEDLTGTGLGSEIRQMYFSTGLKGIDLDNADRVQDLIIRTLTRLAERGIDPLTIEAALNSIEFKLRENNTGSFPRGLLLMLRSMTTWLYDNDPLELLAFESPLNELKSAIASNNSFFEDMIREYFLENPHRMTLILRPDPNLDEMEKEAEKTGLKKAKETMTPEDIDAILENTRQLRQAQETPDPTEALAAIPMLKVADLEKENKRIPLLSKMEGGSRLLFHDIFTNGIFYLDLGFNLHTLPQKYLAYSRIFGKAVLEMGTETEDYVTLTQRISRKTGGIDSILHTSSIKERNTGAAWLFLRGKAMSSNLNDLLEILRDILLTVRLDNKERFRQIVLEAKAREEQRLVPTGHLVVNQRIRAHFTEADWAAEQMNGLSYLFFLRKLTRLIDEDWPGVLSDLQEMHNLLINRNALLVNITIDEKGRANSEQKVIDFLNMLPASDVKVMDWSPADMPGFEGLTIPSQVNYVGKGANLYKLGYNYHGSSHVICRYLRNSWLWDRVRVQGGAYGAFCLFDRHSGTLTFVSYRDPNLDNTIDVFDGAAGFLRTNILHDDELTKGIIGCIGDVDAYKLPDAKGYTSMVHFLSGETDADRQRMREEILSTKAEDFRAFADVLDSVAKDGIVKILGAQAAIKESLGKRQGWLDLVKVL